ncbi:DUF6318 family protein [Kribbella sp. CA-293567]|uniref:DUF6318 family protein n=1 Tax=Kribbella sp. CA-293567 TaxID=3002436 RepID=UPI0022DD72F9|nr:DUF6318 family protein [Kribbella sp. CA-293567]WBQ04606.1 DUF6318 family protein [Kribbella sp. CA-293567]
MITRNRQTRALISACLCAALLTACNNDSPEAGRPNTAPPSQTATPTQTSAAPSTGSTSSATSPTSAPTRPPAAVGSSLAAGEAFIAYYIELLNYSYITGDPAPFLSESEKDCIACKGLADYARQTNAKNGGLQGDFKDQLIEVKEIYKDKAGRLGGLASLKTGTYQERATPGAPVTPQAASTGAMDFTLSSSAGNWVMYEMQIKE